MRGTTTGARGFPLIIQCSQLTQDGISFERGSPIARFLRPWATSPPPSSMSRGLGMVCLEKLDKEGTLRYMYKNPKMHANDFKMYFEDTCESIYDQYEHVIIIGDLNFNMLHNNALSVLCPVYNLTNIINEPICFKSNRATLIDVMLVTKHRKVFR